MTESVEKVIKTPILTKVTFALTVCEILFGFIEIDKIDLNISLAKESPDVGQGFKDYFDGTGQIGVALAREALDICWDWETNLSRGGSEIYYFLFRDDEDGLILYLTLSDQDEKQLAIWQSITTTVLYVSKQAFSIAGETMMPSPVNEVDDEALSLLAGYAETMGVPDINDSINRVGNYLLEKYSESANGDLGRSVSREEIFSLLAI